MIIGTFIRNVKTYSGINYIPLSSGHSYCGLMGNNGIGKSSIVEALDYLFNQKKWNYNIITKKSGLTTTEPYIVPIFLINKENISKSNKPLAKVISNYLWNCNDSDFIGKSKRLFEKFKNQRRLLKRDELEDNNFLIPIGLTFEDKPNVSIFKTPSLEKKLEDFIDQSVEEPFLELLKPLINELLDLYEYIYIPKDINPDNFTQLETEEIQRLMGETLNDIVAKCVPKTKIKEINNQLNSFIDKLSDTLGDYSFRTSGERQVNLRKHDVYKLIIEAYFNIRKLHKKEGNHWLDLNSLSSGEKQKAIMELAYQFLKNYRKNTENLILAIDEPEASLHMSACYDQFNRLAEMNEMCNQLFFTTHWYGFIPTIEDGCICVITKSKQKNEHLFDLIRVKNYREEVKQSTKNSKGKLPYDIRLKSINDFTQSIITSILTNEPFNWLICEGSSEKIYFEEYFKDIKEEKKLRIIPVGGAPEIKRIYNNLKVAYDDFKKDVKGKVIMISDTDSKIVKYPVETNYENLKCLRIVNDEDSQQIKLVPIHSNSVSPETEIEDALNGKQFYNTLKLFKDEFPVIEDIIKDVDTTKMSNSSSFYALDLSPSKQKKLKNIFDTNNMKFRFAKKYCLKSEKHKTPNWVNKIKNMY